MSKRVLLILAMVVATSIWCSGSALGAEDDIDTWKPIRFLLGEWTGQGKGFGGKSSVENTYEFVMAEKFIRSHTLLTFELQEGESQAQVHEDWGFFSYDSDRDKLIFRQFLSEGFVNTYVLGETGPDSEELVFTSEATENAGGMLARLTFVPTGEDEYKLTLDLAEPGSEFFTYQTLVLRKATTHGCAASHTGCKPTVGCAEICPFRK